MKVANIAVLVFAAFLPGCSHRQFDRFMDHPILSWAPFTQADVDHLNPLYTAPTGHPKYPDSQCRELARERSEFLDIDQYSEADLADIFDRTYHDCIAAKARYPS